MILQFLYVAINAVSLLAYVPQLWKLATSSAARQSVAVTSWAMWTAAYLVELAYVWNTNGLMPLKVTTALYAALTLTVCAIGMASRLRAKPSEVKS